MGVQADGQQGQTDKRAAGNGQRGLQNLMSPGPRLCAIPRPASEHVTLVLLAPTSFQPPPKAAAVAMLTLCNCTVDFTAKSTMMRSWAPLELNQLILVRPTATCVSSSRIASAWAPLLVQLRLSECAILPLCTFILSSHCDPTTPHDDYIALSQRKHATYTDSRWRSRMPCLPGDAL